MGRSTSATRRSPAARGQRRLAAALLVAGLCGAASVLGSCHAFSDLPPPGTDAGLESGTPDVVTSGDSAPPADLPGFLSLTEALQLCAKVLTCPHVGPSLSASFGLPVDPTNFSECVHTLTGPIDPRRVNAVTTERLRCAARATGCNVASCVNAEEIDVADPRIDPACADGGVAERCDGDTLLTCVTSSLGNGGWALHCDDPVYAAGSKCFVTNGAGACNLATSGCPSSPRCVDGSEPLSVSDFCVDAGAAVVHSKFDCRVSGRSCQVGLSGCAAAPCGFQLQTQCVDGTKVGVCRFGQLATLDCGPAGGKSHCETHDLASYCSGPHEECTPYDPTPAGGQGVHTCNGTSISLCIGGRMTSVDCRQAGPDFDCRPGSAPKSNYCGPPP